MTPFKPVIHLPSVAQGPARAKGRRRLIVDPRFQYGFLGWMVGMSMVVVGIIYGASAYFFHRYEARGLEAGLTPDHVFFKLLQEQRADMDAIFVLASLACIVVLVVAGALMSHRVAGPVVKLRRHLDAVVQGETSQDVSFRKNDYFLELVASVNGVLDIVRRSRKKPGSRTMSAGSYRAAR